MAARNSALSSVFGTQAAWRWFVSLLKAEQEFAQKLGLLEGQEFQDEVCRFLRRSVGDFQAIPAKPHGDAGLDGLSHGQTVAYCCYGPEQEPSKVKARGLATDIIVKFRDDLRRLFELESKGKGKKTTLDHCPNAEMKTILATGKKIVWVRLIVSVFDTHRILAPLTEAFEACQQASKCSFVAQNAGFTIWGPGDLSTIGLVDDATVLRLEQRVLLQRVSVVLNAAPLGSPSVPTSDLDAKFDWLESHGTVRPGAVPKLRQHFMQRWLEVIAIDNEFANNSLAIHQSLSAARDEAAIDAELASSNQASAASLLELMRQRLTDRLEQHLGTKLPPELLGRVVDGEVARLIGECPVDWRT